MAVRTELSRDYLSLNSVISYIFNVAAISTYPPDDCCTNINCPNVQPLKKEYAKKTVVYDNGCRGSACMEYITLLFK
jgi:hypothetical protein